MRSIQATSRNWLTRRLSGKEWPLLSGFLLFYFWLATRAQPEEPLPTAPQAAPCVEAATASSHAKPQPQGGREDSVLELR